MGLAVTWQGIVLAFAAALVRVLCCRHVSGKFLHAWGCSAPHMCMRFQAVCPAMPYTSEAVEWLRSLRLISDLCCSSSTAGAPSSAGNIATFLVMLCLSASHRVSCMQCQLAELIVPSMLLPDLELSTAYELRIVRRTPANMAPGQPTG